MEYQEFCQKDEFAKYLGIELLVVAPGFARAQMEIGEQHLNGVGIAHGAAIFALADFAFAMASNSHGRIAVAITAAISFLRASGTGMLLAEAKEVGINYKLATYQVEVEDIDHNKIAVFQGTVYRKKEHLPGEMRPENS